MNRLDQVVKLLKEQLREIEQEKRLLHKAEVRITRALQQFDGAVEVSPNRTRVAQGPHRYDASDIVFDVLAVEFTSGDTFTRKGATNLVMSKQNGTENPLRVGQIHGAIQKLKDMDLIQQSGTRGEYIFMGEVEGVDEPTDS